MTPIEQHLGGAASETAASFGRRMEPIVEHTPRLAGIRTRALELEGEGPPLILLHGYADSADTWRLLLDRLRRQGRAAVALDLPGFGNGRPPRARSADPASARRLPRRRDRALGGGRRRLGGDRRATRSAAPSRCGRPSAIEDRIAGVVPIAPAGLDMPTWFAAIQGAPLVRAMLRSPVPVPEAAVRRAVGSTYQVLAFASPRKADDGRRRRLHQPHQQPRETWSRMLATGERLLPEIRDPFRLAADPLPGAGRLGRARPDGLRQRCGADRRGDSRTPGSSCSRAAGTAPRSRSPTGSPSCSPGFPKLAGAAAYCRAESLRDLAGGDPLGGALAGAGRGCRRAGAAERARRRMSFQVTPSRTRAGSAEGDGGRDLDRLQDHAVGEGVGLPGRRSPR